MEESRTRTFEATGDTDQSAETWLPLHRVGAGRTRPQARTGLNPYLQRSARLPSHGVGAGRAHPQAPASPDPYLQRKRGFLLPFGHSPRLERTKLCSLDELGHSKHSFGPVFQSPDLQVGREG